MCCVGEMLANAMEMMELEEFSIWFYVFWVFFFIVLCDSCFINLMARYVSFVAFDSCCLYKWMTSYNALCIFPCLFLVLIIHCTRKNLLSFCVWLIYHSLIPGRPYIFLFNSFTCRITLISGGTRGFLLKLKVPFNTSHAVFCGCVPNNFSMHVVSSACCINVFHILSMKAG